MPNEGTLTFELDVDDTPARAKLASLVADIQRPELPPEVSAHRTALSDNFSEPAANIRQMVSSAAEAAGMANENARSASEQAEKSASEIAKLWTGASAARIAVNGIQNTVQTAKSGASTLSGLLSSMISTAQSAIRRFRTGGDSNTTADKYAVGLDYVPYDEYPALLHRGEMVLNAAEASAFRNSMADMPGAAASIDYTALAQAMSGLSVQLDGRAVGRLIEPTISRTQSERLARSR